MISKKKGITIGLAIAAVVGIVAGTQSRVTSQCCRSSLEAAFSPPPAPAVVASPVYPQAVPVMVQRPAVYSQPAPVMVQRPVTVISDRPISQTTCRVETEWREEEVTTYETVWEEETRYRQKTITKQVPETSVRTETVKVLKPVWETIEKETSYDVVRYVPETSEREETQSVSRPVTQMQEKQIVETVSRPVQSTVVQQRQYTVNRAVTSSQTQVQDYGRYVTQYTPQPNRAYTRLTWQPGGDYFDPATGTTKRRLPGLYWTEMTAPTQYQANRVWQQNLVTTNVPVTTYVPETVVENVPVNVTTYQQEQVVRTEQVPVTTYVQENVVKKIPVTTYKPVTERVVQKTPVKVCRMQTEEQVREIPVTTYKTVCEVVEEPYTVRVARQVPKVTKVKRPVTVYKKIQETVPVAVPANCATSTVAAPAAPCCSSPAPAQSGNGSAKRPSLGAKAPAAATSTTVARPVYPGPVAEHQPKVLSTEAKAEKNVSDLPSVPVRPKEEAVVNRSQADIVPLPTQRPMDPAGIAPRLNDRQGIEHPNPVAPANLDVPVKSDSTANPIRSAEYSTQRPIVETSKVPDLGSFRTADPNESSVIPAPPTTAPTRIMKNN